MAGCICSSQPKKRWADRQRSDDFDKLIRRSRVKYASNNHSIVILPSISSRSSTMSSTSSTIMISTSYSTRTCLDWSSLSLISTTEFYFLSLLDEKFRMETFSNQSEFYWGGCSLIYLEICCDCYDRLCISSWRLF